MPNPDGAAGITFGTDGWRAPLSEFTTRRVKMVGQAASTFLDQEEQKGPVAIGYDAREHSRGFAEDLSAVLRANGRDVTFSERDCPTPALAWTVATGEFAGGLVVTASHNPPEYNGIKFIPSTGAPALPRVTGELEAHLEAPHEPVESRGERRETDLVAAYLDGVRTCLSDQFGIDTPLDGLTLAYDAMHGSGRGVTDRLLEDAGASVTCLRCDRDPAFGGTAPEPVPENATELLDTVREGDADLGLINDGDADRVGIVTPQRGFLDPNVVLALAYDFLLEFETGDVVRTVSTSSLVDRIASAKDQAVHETPVGFKWVAESMGDHNVLVGGEESGGYGITAHLRNKDGLVIGLLLAIAHRDIPLDERIECLFETHGEIHQDRISLDCPNDHKEAVLQSLEDDLPDAIADTPVDEVSTVDGFKLVLEDGTWILVRPSGTEPKLRLYAEAISKERVDELLVAGESFVEPKVTAVSVESNQTES